MTEEKLQKQVDELDHQIKELVASNKLLTEAFYAKYPDQKIDTTEKPLQDQTVVRDDTTTRRVEWRYLDERHLIENVFPYNDTHPTPAAKFFYLMKTDKENVKLPSYFKKEGIYFDGDGKCWLIHQTEVQKFTKEPGYVSHPPVRDYVKIIEEREPKRLRAIGRSIVRYIEKANKYKAVHEEAEKKCLELDQEPAPPTEE